MAVERQVLELRRGGPVPRVDDHFQIVGAVGEERAGLGGSGGAREGGILAEVNRVEGAAGAVRARAGEKRFPLAEELGLHGARRKDIGFELLEGMGAVVDLQFLPPTG